MNDTIRSLAQAEIDEQLAETGTVDLDEATENVRSFMPNTSWNDVMDVVLLLLEEDES